MSTIDLPAATNRAARSTLSADQLATVRATLVELADDCRRRLERAEAEVGDDDVDDDAPGADFDRAAARSSMQSDLDSLHAIEAALLRIADDTYGPCASCSQPIPFERLEAIPYTQFCVACA